MYQYVLCGLDNIQLKNGYEEIEVNGDRQISITAIDSLHQAIGMMLIKLPRSLTGKEIRFLRIELDLSQSALGLLLDKTDQAIAKWEKDQHPIPRSDDATIRSLYSESRNQDSSVTALLNRFNEIDRELQSLESIFEADGEEWALAF